MYILLISFTICWTVHVSAQGDGYVDPEEDDVRAMVRRTKTEHFPKVEVHVDATNAAFVHVELRNAHITVNGKEFFGFKFRVPKSEGKLTWSFRLAKGYQHWYTIRPSGPMGDIVGIHSDAQSKEDMNGLGTKGTRFMTQELSRGYWETDEDYFVLIHFEATPPDTLPVCLNFISRDSNLKRRDYFPMFYKRKGSWDLSAR